MRTGGRALCLLHAWIFLLVFSGFAAAQTATTTSLMASPNPAILGHPVTLTATVTSGANGKVTFYDGTTILGVSAVSGGQATWTPVLLPSGARSLRAYYGGDVTHAASSSSVVAETVDALPSLGLQPAVAFTVGTNPISAVLGDFNGDGKQDLAVANLYTANVSVLLGTGTGGFQAAVNYNAAVSSFGVASLATGDFNGDGKTDLVVASGSSSFSLMFGNGDGTFQAATLYSVSAPCFTVAVGDFNGDGKADLAFGGTGIVLILLGNGDGTFQAPLSFAIVSTAYSVAVGDFNRDGKADLAVTNVGYVSILLGNGDGTFAAAVNYPFGSYLEQLVVSDLNDDGKPDLVTVDFQAGVGVLLGTGDGTFQSAITYGSIEHSYSLAVGDIHGEGKQDLLAAENYGSGEILYGNGDGTFQPPTPFPVSSTVYAQVVGDFNGDGITDFAVLDYINRSITVHLGGAITDLGISTSHGNGFTQGQVGAEYSITVSNVGAIASAGNVGVVDSLPSGLTATAIAGNGWTCGLATLTCTRSDSLAPGASYPVIEIAVNLASGLTGDVTDTATVSGGGDMNLANNTATDTTVSRLATTIMLTAAPNPSTLSQTVMLTASVTAGATGSVTFYDRTTGLGIAAIASGQGLLATNLLLPGSHSFTARYDGDSNYGPSLSAALAQTVSAHTANGYQPRLSYPAPFASALAIGDFNRDGKPDIVTTNSQIGGINILLGNGDGTMQGTASYRLPSGAYSLAVEVGDFNGDGIPDVIVNSSYQGGVNVFGFFVFLGNGDGTFQSPIPKVTGFPYNDFLIADFNGDGRLDIAATAGSGVDLFFGNGDGTFQSPILMFSSLQNLTNLLVADVNLDGKPDLIASTGTSALILVGNGDGTFQMGRTYALNTFGTQSIAVGDFNGDGRPDIIQIYAGAAEVLLGNGDGTFQAPILTTSLEADTGSSITAGDFNGDGRLDIAYREFYNNTIAVALGNGDGTFQTAFVLATDGGSTGSDTQIALADFNGDGVLDLAVANAGLSNVDIFLGGQFSGLTVSVSHAGPITVGQTKRYTITVNNPTSTTTSSTVTVTGTLPSGLSATALSGTGWNCTLTALTCISSSAVSTGSSFSPLSLTVLAAADLVPSTVAITASVMYGGVTNSVGDPTLIVLPTTTSLSVSQSPALLGQAVTLTATVSTGAGTVLFLEDENILGAGTLSGNQASLITRLTPAGIHKITATYSGDSTHASSTSSVVELTANAGLASGVTGTADLTTGIGPVAVLISDLNGDGRADLVTPNGVANTVSVFFGNGDGSFQPKTDYAVGTQPTGATIADFNGDGKPDIAVSNGISNTISILLNNGDGTFAAGTTITSTGPVNVVAADFDGDGKVDLAVLGGGTGGAGVTIFFGGGDGTFRARFGTILACCAPALAVGDFSGDGKPDLIADSTFYVNNGDGTFGNAIYTNGADAWAVGDLNGDGKADLIGADVVDGVDVYLGNGDGTFKASVHYATGSAPRAVTLADANGDGKLDVIVANLGSNTVSVLLGNGDGTLQQAVSYSVGTSPQGVVAGDFNGDGRTDLAVANSGSNTVSILLGTLAAALNITSTHAGNFYPGETGATYSITVSNQGPGPTPGPLTVTDLLPSALTATAIGGTGWNCVLATLACSRSDPLGASASYPAITLAVNVAPNAPTSVTNLVSVSSISTFGASATDPTTITFPLPGAPV